jgi:hypothetical protein
MQEAGQQQLQQQQQQLARPVQPLSCLRRPQLVEWRPLVVLYLHHVLVSARCGDRSHARVSVVCMLCGVEQTTFREPATAQGDTEDRLFE